MSEDIKPFTLGRARKFNASNVPKLVVGGIPDDAVCAYPGLGDDPSSDSFASAVFNVQQALNLDRDGLFGRSTWNAILSEYDSVDISSNYVVHSSRRIQLPDSEAYTVIAYDEMASEEATCGIKPLELHSTGHFSRRSRDIDSVVMHWGGLDPVHLHAVMSSPDRKVSTHFGVGIVSGEPVVMQYMDLAHKAWHAGFANEGTIGIDICQQPAYKWVGHYQKKGYSVRRKDNPTDRGNAKIISLDPRIAAATNEFVRDLLNVMGLPFTEPQHHGIISKDDLGSPYTIVGHHHLVAKKWDIACWWDDIFNIDHLC